MPRNDFIPGPDANFDEWLANFVAQLGPVAASLGVTPAETTEQCGDHWTRVVNLSNEWQFYTVPFNTMAQQGWAKRSPGLDPSSISVIRFTWDGGWIDYWIDDVRIYRRKPPPTPQ